MLGVLGSFPSIRVGGRKQFHFRVRPVATQTIAANWEVEVGRL